MLTTDAQGFAHYVPDQEAPTVHVVAPPGYVIAVPATPTEGEAPVSEPTPEPAPEPAAEEASETPAERAAELAKAEDPMAEHYNPAVFHPDLHDPDTHVPPDAPEGLERRARVDVNANPERKP